VNPLRVLNSLVDQARQGLSPSGLHLHQLLMVCQTKVSVDVSQCKLSNTGLSCAPSKCRRPHNCLGESNIIIFAMCYRSIMAYAHIQYNGNRFQFFFSLLQMLKTKEKRPWPIFHIHAIFTKTLISM
jgi:hypothetical protein